jgi:hypothetical protein
MQLADQARSTADQALTRAAEACNLAALIASDCGMPGLARDLCWRQYGVFAQARIRDETTAKLALQPLINLARLHIRDGDGDAGPWQRPSLSRRMPGATRDGGSASEVAAAVRSILDDHLPGQ